MLYALLCALSLATGVTSLSEPRSSEPAAHTHVRWQPRNPPVIDFFLRTWKGDGVWNVFLLRSIEAHVPASLYRDILVVYRKEENAYFESYLPFIPLSIRLFPEDEIYLRPGMNGGGYYSQMISKFMTFKYSDADYFIHVDSDNLVKRPIELHDLMDGQGRVYVKTVLYKDLETKFKHWQKHAETMLQESVPAETMTGFPIVFPRDLYQNFINHVERVHKKSFMDVLMTAEDFNEFTPIGGYLLAHMPGRWVENATKTDIVQQKWSWNGVNADTVAIYEELLRGSGVENKASLLKPEPVHVIVPKKAVSSRKGSGVF